MFKKLWEFYNQLTLRSSWWWRQWSPVGNLGEAKKFGGSFLQWLAAWESRCCSWLVKGLTACTAANERRQDRLSHKAPTSWPKYSPKVWHRKFGHPSVLAGEGSRALFRMARRGGVGVETEKFRAERVLKEAIPNGARSSSRATTVQWWTRWSHERRFQVRFGKWTMK